MPSEFSYLLWQFTPCEIHRRAWHVSAPWLPPGGCYLRCCWVAARFDLLATLLMLWTLIFYLRARRAGSIPRYAAAAACFVLALLSKESAYLIPFVLCAAELLLFEHRSWRAPTPFFVIAAGAMGWRLARAVQAPHRPAGRCAT